MSESNPDTSSTAPLTRAQQLFRDAPQEQRELLRQILKHERDVMHLRRRSEIHQRIVDEVKAQIK
jgi:predicted small metal-binding protein